jgi:DNA polymerase III epsilon subunit-like protein
MKLFFDIETTGLPEQISYDEWYTPEEVTKYANSRIIELGIIVVHNDKIIDTYNSIVKPDNFTSLEKIITDLTGITDEEILDEGKDLKQVIKEIQPLLDKVKVINSYNIKFDYNVLLSELYRCHDKKTITKLKNMKKECTLQLATRFLKRDKYLKLEHLYKMLFNHDPKQDHRAFNDAIMCKDVYYGLKEIYKNKNKNKNKDIDKNKSKLSKQT